MRLLLIILALLLTLAGFSQKQLNPFFNQYSTKNYPGQDAHSLLWDEQGHLWGASGVSIFKDDGFSIKEFKPEGIIPSKNQFITSLNYDEKQKLIWATFFSGDSIASFHVEEQRFEFYHMNSPNPGKFFTIKAVTFDFDKFYILKWGGGFSIFDSSEKKFKHYYNDGKESATSIPINFVKSIIPFENGKFLLGFFKENKKNPGLTVYDPKNESFNPLDLEPFLKDVSPTTRIIVEKGLKIVHFIHSDASNNLWVGTYIGLFHIDFRNKKIIRISGLEQDETVQNADNCITYEMDNNGYYWVITPYNGVMVVNPNTFGVKYIKNDPTNKNSIGSNFLSAVFKDPSGNLWIRLQNKNFSIYNPYYHSFEMHPWADMDLDFENRSSQIIPVNQMTVLKDGKLLISSGNGLTLYNSNTNQSSKVFQFEDNGSLNYLNFPYFTINDQKLYFFKNGYPHKLNLENNELTKVNHQKGEVDPKSNHDPVFTHFGAIDNKAYFSFRKKIFSFDLTSLEYHHEYTIDSIHFFLQKNKNRLLSSGKWLLHESKSPKFMVFDPTTEKVQVYGKEQGFEDSTYLNAFVEGDSVWLCTNSGLILFKENEGSFKRYNDQLGIDSVSVVFITRGFLGDLWVGLEDKILRWNTTKHEVSEFDEKYGLNVSTFLPGVPQQDALGNIYIASVNGIIKFNPQNIKEYNEDFKIHFSSIVVNNDTVVFSPKHPVESFTKKFSFSENNLVFNIGNNQYIKEQPHEFFYRIKQRSEDWVNNGSSSSIRLSNLDYGPYTLEIKALNSYGVPSNVIEFTFHINKPFWMSWWFFVLTLSVLVTLVWLLIKAREKKIKRRNRQLEATVKGRTREVVEKADKISEQKDIIEEKNKEIIDSINYAQRIQSAYLPPEETFHKIFNNGFVYFQPKDLVSGDFYWFFGKKNEKGEKEVFVAAADCTGHGVPGALMSVICCNAMNETVITRKVEDPGQILDTTRDIVKKSLKSNVNTQYKDGMDISLCKINLDTYKVNFAGAHNPLWIVTARTEEITGARSKQYEDLPYTLWEVKGDKQPIGLYEHEKPFSTHSLHLKEGDRIYMFSDGYQDQFGGEDISDSKKGGKKFKSANFKKLLISIFDRTMEEQKKELHRTFIQWKGDLEQIDDVCVIGIRL